MALTLSTLFFILSTLAVTPFYVLMITAPRAAFTRRVLGSLWPVALPTLVYGLFLLLILLLLRPDVLGLWRALYVEHGLFGATTVAFLSRDTAPFPSTRRCTGGCIWWWGIWSWRAGPIWMRWSGPRLLG